MPARVPTHPHAPVSLPLQGREVFAHLRPPWSDLPYRVGDAVNLVARLDVFDGQHHCLLDMESGLLVLHPDVLLSGGAALSRQGPAWRVLACFVGWLVRQDGCRIRLSWAGLGGGLAWRYEPGVAGHVRIPGG
jgi:hypothetical protein